jgi:FAD:protein FMN transferase
MMGRREFLGALAAGISSTVLSPGRVTAEPLFRRTTRPHRREFVERWSWAMGQAVHLQLFAGSADEGYAAAEAALAELRRVEQHLTRFSDTSDLSELNRRAGLGPMLAGSDLETVLRQSLLMERLTRGAFNPAIEPLMQAWGFRRPRRTEPSSAELAEARECVQAARIVLKNNRISLPSRHTRLDLGGIGVGYGLDRAAARLRSLNISSAFLDVSGDCFALGAPPGEEGWLVEIASPRPGGVPLASTRLRDAALATSSNSMSVVHYGRAVRGHVMNPDTGWPADALVQVSVVARTGIEADALSTAMLVAGRPWKGVLRYYRTNSS